MSSSTQPDSSVPSPVGFRFSWHGFALLALLIYELTSDACLGITLFCTKFGWDHFRTALWLKRRDPVWGRGWLSFCIFIAAGLWRTAVAGFVLMFAFVAVTLDKKQQANGPPPVFMEAALVTFFGFLTSVCATLFALAVALWQKRKIWLDAGAHKARELDQWPPITTNANQAGTLILTSLIATALPLGGATFGFLVIAARQFQLANEVVAMACVLGAFLLVPILILVARDYLQRRILARDSTEFWQSIPPLNSDTIDSINRLE